MRIVAVSLGFAAALALASPAFAEDSPVDPIDAALATCLDSADGQSTAGMVQCLTTAYDAWDKELNTVYLALNKSLDAKSRGLLKRSQRQWIAYRDAERKFETGPWINDRGTLIRVTLNRQNVEMVKNRVLTLRSYLPDMQ
ncbi:DUF1311 domain-containing protein [Kaistia dalseonensis]|uniref:Uncharacterized protein YecT (DUF1311 family) n=1 Tax=Kaistia dalseonensis TaxID=410840 RepID=A0ABU0H9R6_9HYPH|nr:lysozyme inhibitor LprI family protein [Kaistia dalseonensis]MCX5495902.1 DUF1311 domain-containing protein [Kaistia dalseonensis]MDQ0438505.1 uncharacterized protein YecT (DUF1311 family) [Kaistia dalseonensis]